MKKQIKTVITFVLALALIFNGVFCLSSCSSEMQSYIGGFIDGIFGGGEGENDVPTPVPTPDKNGETGGNTNTDDEDENDENESVDSETEEETEDDKMEFYPGQGSVSPENISPLNRALLSSVVIVAKFGLSPSAGSGVIYKLDKEKGDAYIITNYHVIFNKGYGMCDDATLYLYGMQYADYAITATVLGGSLTNDIAVLKVEGSEVLKNSYALEADLGDSEQVRVFDEVVAIGNPEAYGMAATEGIISVDSESLDMTGADGTAIELRVMRISAAINEGNSGGGVFDVESGKLVGIVCAKRIGSDIDNIAYAIPVNLAKNLVDNIIHFCDGETKIKVNHAAIGVVVRSVASGIVADPVTGEIVKKDLVVVDEIGENCIAKDQIMVGDVVNSLTVDGVKVDITRIYHAKDHMLNARVGSTVVMNVTRDGVSVDITMTVTEAAFSVVK